MIVRWFSIVLSIVLAAAVLACDDDEGPGEVAVEPTSRVPGVSAPQGDERIYEIEINHDRVERRQLRVTAGAPGQVQVVNRGSTPCTFFVGDLLIGESAKTGSPGRKTGRVTPSRSGAPATSTARGMP